MNQDLREWLYDFAIYFALLFLLPLILAENYKAFEPEPSSDIRFIYQNY